jgi:hypothetical protein
MLTQEQLQKFCAKIDFNFECDYRTPARKDGYVYATDGRICIRVIDDGSLLAFPPAGRLKDIDLAKVFDGEKNCDIPMPELPARIECKHCHGTCLEHDCPMCEGQGMLDGDVAPITCPRCEGNRRIKPDHTAEPCWWCNGRGEQEDNPVLIGGMHFNRVYLALAAELPGARFVRIDGYTVARIEFDGGEIAIMPTRVRKT